MKGLFCSAICIFVVGQLLCQNATGLIKDDFSYENTSRWSPPLSPKASDPIKLKVNLRPYCPSPANQGNTGACVSMAVAYGAFTITRAIQNQITDTRKIDQIAHSAFYIHNQLNKGRCKEGTSFEQVLQFIKREGTCLASTFNDADQTCARQPGTRERDEAKNFKIAGFQKLFDLDEPRKEKEKQLQLALSLNRPVIIGMDVPGSFHIIKGKNIWNQVIPPEADRSGHALVLIGYDYEKNYLEVMNSWGNQTWGDGGFARISYEAFFKMLNYAYTIEEDNGTDNDPSVTTVKIKVFPTLVEKNGMTKSSLVLLGDFDLQGKFYTVSSIKWKLGYIYQLIVENDPDIRFLYVFCVEPDNTIKWHRPFEEKGLIVTPEISPYKPVVIPGPDHGLQLNKIGSEFICLLFSKQPILNLKASIAKVRPTNRNIYDHLVLSLGSQIAPANSIAYELRSIGFSSNNADGIIPLIIHIKVDN